MHIIDFSVIPCVLTVHKIYLLACCFVSKATVQLTGHVGLLWPDGCKLNGSCEHTCS
jgi:hypothetical protein